MLSDVESSDRAALLPRMEEAGIRTGSFPNDLAIGGPALRRIQWHFQQGVVVLPGSAHGVARVEDRRVGARSKETV